MGIKSINTLFKEKCPEAYTTLLLSLLSGYRIAVDGPGWFYAHMAGRFKDHVFKMQDPLEEVDQNEILNRLLIDVVEFTTYLIEMKITPVWVWDGPSFPEKAVTRDKRKKSVQKLREDAEKTATILRETHQLMRTNEMMTAYKKKKALSFTVTAEEINVCKQVLSGLGIINITAPNDAEIFCVSLNRENLVAGVWSVDTDCYCLGASLMITGFNGTDANKNPIVDIVYPGMFGQSFGMTLEEIRDLCIMCGCDFNENMRGIGPKKSLGLLQKYKTIEAIEVAGHPTKCLNYKRCREIFTAPKTGFDNDAKELQIDREVFNDFGRELCQQYDMMDQFVRLVAAFKKIAGPKMVEQPKRRLLIVEDEEEKTPISPPRAILVID